MNPMMASSSGQSSSTVGGAGGINRRGAGPVVPAALLSNNIPGGVGGGVISRGGGGSSTGDREYCCFVWDIEQSSSSAGGGGAGSSSSSLGVTGASSFNRRTRSTPIFKLAHQIGVASLGWVLENGQTLALGAQMRNLFLYDLRLSTNNPQPPVSVYAHNFGVHGIEPDPHRSWQFATFCRAANEPVKLWDARMLDSALSEIKLYGGGVGAQQQSQQQQMVPQNSSSSSLSAQYHYQNSMSSGSGTTNNPSTGVTVSAIQWSPTEQGRLLIAVGDTFHEYDISGTGSRPNHSSVLSLHRSVFDFCVYPYPKQQHTTRTKTSSSKIAFSSSNADANNTNVAAAAESSIHREIIKELLPNRMMVLDNDRYVTDVARQRLAPVALSRRDGRLVHGFGRALWVGSPADGPAAMECLQISEEEDISATMMRRARCKHVAKYSMDTTSNIKILAEDGILAEKSSSIGTLSSSQIRTGSLPNSSPPAREGLLRLWSWIERVESLCSETEDPWVDWPARGLIDAGAWRLLLANEYADDVQVLSIELSCVTFDSRGRRAALASCGWAGKYDLVNVMGECEDLGEFERSAALAVWHGDIGMAVEALQRGASYIRGQLEMKNDRGRLDLKKTAKNSLVSSQYAETLELVALSVAGYRGGDGGSPAASVWRRACANLMQRSDLAVGRTTSRTAYLRSLLKFLITIGSDIGHLEILADSTLSLCDRVGFACRFLPRDELKNYMEKQINACQTSGDVEGVTITGIGKEGIKILQSYVDLYADVQSAALVTSRVLFPPEWTEERTICLEWLDCYRSLLNTWQMWQSRSMFDVDRADLLRKLKWRQANAIGPTGVGIMGGKPPMVGGLGSLQARRPPTGSRKLNGNRQFDPDVQASVPAQLDVRCNYCSSSLGLKSQDTTVNQWLSKMKPILSCCPQCRKPLPRCSICLLSLGSLNPYMELTKQDRGRLGRSGAQTTDDLSSLASLPFAEWFTWCMRCKHGGHAHHLIGWFAKHEICSVSGCNCQCQFDGIQKLDRPVLSRRKSDRSVVEPGFQKEMMSKVT